MGRGVPPRPLLKRWVVPGVLIAFLLSSSVFALLNPDSSETIGVVGMMVGQIFAGILMFSRSRSLERRERQAWRFIAVALLCTGTGVLVVGILFSMGVAIPAFGWPDIMFLAGYTLLVFSFIRLARADGAGADWLPTIIDAAVGGIALAVLVWTTFFRDLVDTLQGVAAWELVIALTYPILDIAAVVGLIILVIRRSHFHLDARLGYLAIGIGLQVINDFAYLSRGVGKTFAEAQPLFGVLLLATACFVTASAIVDIVPRKREFPEREAPVWALVWPYLLAGALVGALVGRYRTLNPPPDMQLLLDAVILIGILILARQVLMIHRHRVQVERQRSELVASVSHELRTPLTVMVGYLAILDEDGDEFPEPVKREMISEASEQARHMARLVSDLVMLAKGDHRHLPLEINEVSVSSITSAALRSVETKHTRIEEELDSSSSVRVDADRIQQALSNLLSNAVRYGGDRAILSAVIVGEDLVLEVHDNGDGVPTKYESAVWQRFERGAHRLNASTPGLGIGLAIVEAVAESHGGRASYRTSERLGGACFSLEIPGCVADKSVEREKVQISSR